jgi:hypothetical protein
VEVYLTDAQFAQMITSPNQSVEGVACTINRAICDQGQPWVHPRHGGRPEPPEPEHYTQKYKDVMGERSETISEHIAKAKKQIDALMDGTDKPTKTNLKALQNALHMAQMNFDKNMPYVMEEMSEGIEKKMATAVGEFESYVSFSLQAKGLEHLASQTPRLTSAATTPRLLPGEEIKTMEIKPSYKQIVNYLRNELEITRDYIREVVEKSIANAVKQAIEERLTDGRLDREIANAVRQVTTDTTNSYTSSRESFEKAVREESRKQIGKILTKEFDIQFSIKPTNEIINARVIAATLQQNQG